MNFNLSSGLKKATVLLGICLLPLAIMIIGCAAFSSMGRLADYDHPLVIETAKLSCASSTQDLNGLGMEKLATKKNTSVIQLQIGLVNLYIIKGEKSILVDSGWPGDTQAILDQLKAININPKEISLIILTHSHMEHFGSTADMRDLTGAPIAIHLEDADCLKNGVNSSIKPRSILGHLLSPVLSRIGKSSMRAVEPDILIDEKMDLDPFGVQGYVIHTPGHTPGSISIILPNGDAIVGDLMIGGIGGVFNQRSPNHHMFANDPDAVDKSIQKIMGFSPKRFFVGHGGPLSPEDVFSTFIGG